MRTKTAALAALAISLSIMSGVSSASSDNPAGCADDAPGGEWRKYGQDLTNQRNQHAENVIDAAWVQNMTVDWKFTPSSLGMSGGFSNTPIVADGCVYAATNTGWIAALNADTGELLWSKKLTGRTQSATVGGVIIGSVAVENGVLFAGSNSTPPKIHAFDQETGAPLWQAVIETGQNSAQYTASPVVHNGMLFAGITGDEANAEARGGFVIIDASHDCGGDAVLPAGHPQAGTSILTCFNPVSNATGGTRLAHQHTITNAEYAAGYRGASIWCTAAVDTVTNYVYACGGNPAKRPEARFSNALLKIDMDRSRPTFGTIVGSYKGDYDNYYPGLDRQPVCDANEDGGVVWSQPCLQLDLDFGASPILFKDSLGNTMLGDVQKSGVFHTVYADHMSRSWTQIVGTPGVAMNAASPAYGVAGGEARVFVGASSPTVMEALSAEQGRYRWATPIGTPTHFNSTSFANGLVYTTAFDGTLNVFNAANGLPVAKRSITQDAGASASENGSTGVAIARHQLFVAQSQFLIAYK